MLTLRTRPLIRGESVSSKTVPKKPLASDRTKRTCYAPGCATVLSRYNLGLFCFSHDNPADDRLPRSRP
jgi:hypothetical protein